MITNDCNLYLIIFIIIFCIIEEFKISLKVIIQIKKHQHQLLIQNNNLQQKTNYIIKIQILLNLNTSNFQYNKYNLTIFDIKFVKFRFMK